jgi:hypothetical protein
MPSLLNDIGLKHGTDKASSGHNVLRLYEQFIRDLRFEEFILLEIGGLNGSSLRMWEEYFSSALVVCIDINPNVVSFQTERTKVEIGNSGSQPFLRSVIEKHGVPKIILDDGSHRWDHQRIAFKSLFPLLEPGGLYIVEDLHTSFEAGFAGVDDHPFIHMLHKLSDYLQLRGGREHFERVNNAEIVTIAKEIEFITFIPRSCIIKKKGKNV